MEKKYIKVSFDVEMAKRISNGEVDGKIITRDGRNVRVVCWDARGDLCILALLEGKSKDDVGAYPNDGRIFMEGESPADLMLEIPEYMTFKDGDVVKQSNEAYTWLSIIKNVKFCADEGTYHTDDYVSLLINDGDSIPSFDTQSSAAEKIEKATEEEKQKLIDPLRESEKPKGKEYLKRFFGIEVKPKHHYKDGDLYMTTDGGIGIYSDKYECGCFMPFHIYMNSEGTLIRSNGLSGCGIISECKPITSATDRIRMVQALRKDENLISKVILKKYFDDEDWIKSIGFKQGVLVRASDKDEWVPAEYGYYSEKFSSHVVFGGIMWKQCIPYTLHTKHLMGTTDNWEEIV